MSGGAGDPAGRGGEVPVEERAPLVHDQLDARARRNLPGQRQPGPGPPPAAGAMGGAALPGPQQLAGVEGPVAPAADDTTSPSATLAEDVAPIDHQHLAGHEVAALEQVQQRGHRVPGVPSRRSGVVRASRSRSSASYSSGTSTAPGAIALTVTSGASAQRQHAGEHHDAGLADRVGGEARPRLEPPRSAILTTLPRAARSAGAAPWVQKKTDRRLRSSTASYWAGVVSSNGSRCMTAAELTSTSSPPSSAGHPARQLRGGTRVGQVGREARGPAARRDDLVPQLLGPGGGGVVVDGDGHPRPASARAMARPRRRPAPVTSATRPRSSISPSRAARSAGSRRSARRARLGQREHAPGQIIHLHVRGPFARGGDVVGGAGHARRHGVHPDLPLGQLERQAPGEARHRRLGRRVHGHRTLGLEVGDRREVHDAPPGLRERRDRGLGDQHGRLEVDRHLAVDSAA